MQSRFFAVAARFRARASLTFSGVTVVDRGRIVDGAVVDMSGVDIEITVDVGLGACEAVARGCDITCGSYELTTRLRAFGTADAAS